MTRSDAYVQAPRTPLVPLGANENWGERGLCRDTPQPDTWFGGRDGGNRDVAAMVARAKKVCARCPVINECRLYAIASGERNGVWGGIDFADTAERRGAKSRMCKAGHLVAGENARPSGRGGFICRICNNEQRRERRARAKELERRIELQRDQLDRIVAERMESAA